ncbi:hypothetical protein SD78_0849 [Bacillus badius]|nr:hypothetical protein SD78_0849 [Bacillus badius]
MQSSFIFHNQCAGISSLDARSISAWTFFIRAAANRLKKQGRNKLKIKVNRIKERLQRAVRKV